MQKTLSCVPLICRFFQLRCRCNISYHKSFTLNAKINFFLFLFTILIIKRLSPSSSTLTKLTCHWGVRKWARRMAILPTWIGRIGNSVLPFGAAVSTSRSAKSCWLLCFISFNSSAGGSWSCLVCPTFSPVELERPTPQSTSMPILFPPSPSSLLPATLPIELSDGAFLWDSSDLARESLKWKALSYKNWEILNLAFLPWLHHFLSHTHAHT